MTSNRELKITVSIHKKKVLEKICCKLFPVEFMPNGVQNCLEYELNFTVSDYSTSKTENFATQKITFVTSVLLITFPWT